MVFVLAQTQNDNWDKFHKLHPAWQVHLLYLFRRRLYSSLLFVTHWFDNPHLNTWLYIFIYNHIFSYKLHLLDKSVICIYPFIFVFNTHTYDTLLHPSPNPPQTQTNKQTKHPCYILIRNPTHSFPYLSPSPSPLSYLRLLSNCTTRLVRHTHSFSSTSPWYGYAIGLKREDSHEWRWQY